MANTCWKKCFCLIVAFKLPREHVSSWNSYRTCVIFITFCLVYQLKLFQWLLLFISRSSFVLGLYFNGMQGNCLSWIEGSCHRYAVLLLMYLLLFFFIMLIIVINIIVGVVVNNMNIVVVIINNNNIVIITGRNSSTSSWCGNISCCWITISIIAFYDYHHLGLFFTIIIIVLLYLFYLITVMFNINIIIVTVIIVIFSLLLLF